MSSVEEKYPDSDNFNDSYMFGTMEMCSRHHIDSSGGKGDNFRVSFQMVC